MSQETLWVLLKKKKKIKELGMSFDGFGISLKRLGTLWEGHLMSQIILYVTGLSQFTLRMQLEGLKI